MNKSKILKHYKLESYENSLKDYKHVSDTFDLNEGGFYRWINPAKLTLTNGAFLASAEAMPDGLFMKFKCANGRVLSMWSDDVILFKKTSQEDKLRDAIKRLHNSAIRTGGQIE